MPFMLAQMFGQNAGACALLTRIFLVTVPLSSAFLVAMSNSVLPLRLCHVSSTLEDAASAAMCLPILAPMPDISCSTRMLLAQHSLPPPVPLSSGPLWHPRRTIFTLSALTSFTVLSMSEGVSSLKTRSEATKVHTCTHMDDHGYRVRLLTLCSVLRPSDRAPSCERPKTHDPIQLWCALKVSLKQASDLQTTCRSQMLR